MLDQRAQIQDNLKCVRPKAKRRKTQSAGIPYRKKSDDATDTGGEKPDQDPNSDQRSQ